MGGSKPEGATPSQPNGEGAIPNGTEWNKEKPVGGATEIRGNTYDIMKTQPASEGAVAPTGAEWNKEKLVDQSSQEGTSPVSAGENKG